MCARARSAWRGHAVLLDAILFEFLFRAACILYVAALEPLSSSHTLPIGRVLRDFIFLNDLCFLCPSQVPLPLARALLPVRSGAPARAPPRSGALPPPAATRAGLKSPIKPPRSVTHFDLKNTKPGCCEKKARFSLATFMWSCDSIAPLHENLLYYLCVVLPMLVRSHAARAALSHGVSIYKASATTLFMLPVKRICAYMLCRPFQSLENLQVFWSLKTPATPIYTSAPYRVSNLLAALGEPTGLQKRILLRLFGMAGADASDKADMAASSLICDCRTSICALTKGTIWRAYASGPSRSTRSWPVVFRERERVSFFVSTASSNRFSTFVDRSEEPKRDRHFFSREKDNYSVNSRVE